MRLPAGPLFLLLVLFSVSVPPTAAQSRRPGPAQKSPVPVAARSPALIEPTIPETTIRVDVNLVSFPATVTDHYGRYVGSLRRQDFTLLEDGVPQRIAVFHNEIVPVSVGVAIDTSGSMVDKIHDAADGLIHFVNTIQPGDDVFLIRFARTVELELDFTANRALFRRAVHRLHARGSTRLYDALAEALDKVRSGRHQKKAIVLITDGNDTSSYVGFEEVLEMARRSEVLVYAMGIGHGHRGWLGELRRYGRGRRGQDRVDMRVLGAIADATGGLAFHLEDAHRPGADLIDQAAQEISTELRQHYTVGYYPTNGVRGGTYRKIQLESKVPGLRVRHRRGYYAPGETAAVARP